jgi:hypothetical protein
MVDAEEKSKFLDSFIFMQNNVKLLKSKSCLFVREEDKVKIYFHVFYREEYTPINSKHVIDFTGENEEIKDKLHIKIETTDEQVTISHCVGVQESLDEIDFSENSNKYLYNITKVYSSFPPFVSESLMNLKNELGVLHGCIKEKDLMKIEAGDAIDIIDRKPMITTLIHYMESELKTLRKQRLLVDDTTYRQMIREEQLENNRIQEDGLDDFDSITYKCIINGRFDIKNSRNYVKLEDLYTNQGISRDDFNKIVNKRDLRHKHLCKHDMKKLSYCLVHLFRGVIYDIFTYERICKMSKMIMESQDCNIYEGLGIDMKSLLMNFMCHFAYVATIIPYSQISHIFTWMVDRNMATNKKVYDFFEVMLRELNNK